jgi:hypothetical protein
MFTTACCYSILLVEEKLYLVEVSDEQSFGERQDFPDESLTRLSNRLLNYNLTYSWAGKPKKMRKVLFFFLVIARPPVRPAQSVPIAPRRPKYIPASDHPWRAAWWSGRARHSVAGPKIAAWTGVGE